MKRGAIVVVAARVSGIRAAITAGAAVFVIGGLGLWEPALVTEGRVSRLKEKVAAAKAHMQRLNRIGQQLQAAPDGRDACICFHADFSRRQTMKKLVQTVAVLSLCSASAVAKNGTPRPIE